MAAPQSRVLETGGDLIVSDAAFSADGRFLAARTMDQWNVNQPRQTFRLFDAKSGKFLASWRLRTLTEFAVSPDGQTVATITGERQRWGIGQPFAVEMRDLRSGVLRRSLVKAGTVDAAFYSLAWSPDGKLIAAGSGDGRVIIWEARTGRRIVSLRVGDAVGALAWSPQRKWLAVANGKKVQLWDWAKSKRVGVGGGSNSVGASLQFSSDGKRLLANDNYRFLRLLEVPALEQLAKQNNSIAAFSHNKQRVMSLRNSDFDTTLVVTDVMLKRQIHKFPRLTDWRIKAISPNFGRQMRWVSASGSDSVGERQTLKLWTASLN